MSDAAPPHDSRVVGRNFICHCLEGGLYMGGTAFLAPESVMPAMVKTLGGAAWIIAMMPVVLPAAFAAAGLFVAPVIERLPRFKPWVVSFGLLQRLPYLVTGLILLSADHIDNALLPIVVLTPVVSGLIGGIGMVAWMEMVTRMVPARARAAGWAIRYIIQAAIGMAAGAAIHFVLTHYPGREGYAWLHLCTFALLLLSWISQLFMKETLIAPSRSAEPEYSYLSYLSGLPALLTSQPHLIKLIFARFTGMGYLMVVSFLTIHALRVTGRPEADEGHFVTLQAVGTVLGSLLGGWVGYQSGGKVLLLSSRVVCVLLCSWVATTGSFTGFVLAYFALGFGLFLDRVGDLTLAAELCPLERRTTLQALLGFANVFAFLLATFISGQIYHWTQSFHLVAVTAAAFAVISMVILQTIPEPRRAATVPPQA